MEESPSGWEDPSARRQKGSYAGNSHVPFQVEGVGCSVSNVSRLAVQNLDDSAFFRILSLFCSYLTYENLERKMKQNVL